APAEAETGAVLVDPLQRARAALEDARRQMPSMLGLAEEPAAPLRPERTAIVPAQETRLAEWNALLQELVQERRSLAAEIGALRGLVLELRGEVERLNDMLAAPDSAAPAAPAPTDLAPAEAPSAAPAEAGDALAALAQLDVAAADETVPAGHGLEVNVRLLAEIEERLARGFTGEPARPTPPSWMERSIWRLPVNAPAAAADERAPAPAAAISTPSEATPAEQPEDAGGDEQAPARPGAATPEAATDPEAATLPLQPRLPAGPVVRDFGWRVHPDALEDRLPESWHRHAAVASVPAPATPSHTTPAEAAPLALLIGPVAGIKRLAALERRLASAAAVQRLELATFRGGDALFRVRLRPGAAPEALLDSVGDEDASVGDYILTEDRRSLTVRLQAVAPPAGAS
ncbi:MAG TPA: hypothetical protein VFA70_00710, partial [Dehalococcoidia bacterium]|nr:hypothetical protein [Dehalococcoidia bacterium]